MKLYDNAASPYAFKVRVVLYEKGLEVEHVEIRSERQRAELLRVSPRGEVPALVDGTTVVYDSTTICEYLEERVPTPPLLPADPAERACVRALERVADTQIDPVVLVLGVVTVFRPDMATSHPDAAARAAQALRMHYDRLDALLENDTCLAGAFSRADVAVMPHVSAAAFMGHGVTDAHPRLAAWVARMNARPSIARATREALAAYREAGDLPDPFFSAQRLHWRDARIEWAIRCGLGPWLLDDLAAGRGFLSPIP